MSVFCKMNLIPVHSRLIPVSFRSISVSFRYHSGPFRSIPAYSGLFRFIPFLSGPFRSIPVSFRCHSVHSGIIPVSFRSIPVIPVHSGSFRSFRSVPVFSNAQEKDVSANPSTPYSRPVGQREKSSPLSCMLLYQPGELEGGVKRATDPIWSLKVYNIERSFTKLNQPVLYYLHDGPKRGFVREELLVVPPNTTLPPADVN